MAGVIPATFMFFVRDIMKQWIVVQYSYWAIYFRYL